MAKVVVFTKEIIRGILIKNFMTGGKGIEETEIWENDIVTDFRYVDENSVKKITGRLDSVSFASKKTKNATGFASTVGVGLINIDCSEEYTSKIVPVKKASILEYGVTDSVDDIMVEPLVKLKLTCLLSDGTSQVLEIREGDEFFGVHIYPTNGNPIHGDVIVKSLAYTITSNQFDITGFTLAMADGSKTFDVAISQIISFGRAGIVVTDPAELISAIASVQSGEAGGVVLGKGVEISDPLAIDGKLSIDGPGIEKSSKIGKDEAVLKAAITCNAGAEVIVRNAVISDNSLTFLNDPASIEFDGCKFVALTGNDTKLYAIKGQGVNTSTMATKLVVKNCYFGANATNMYNFFELNTKIADGSEISGCYFEKACTSHNVINIYEMDNDATFTIANNRFEYSANAIRIGTVGNPQNVVIDILNNRYDETDTVEPEYAGLFFVQPYKTATESMAGITINAIGNKGPKNTQLYYIYCGGEDTQLDDTTKPVINVK